MRILAIDPLAPWGHVNFNAAVLKMLRDVGHVTLVTFRDYQKHFAVDRAIDIPDPLRLASFHPALRMGQPLVIDAILRVARPADYDATVFLCYESISLALKWPKDARAFVFEHNNTDKARENPLKMFFYRRIPPSVTHLVFMDYIGEYISREFGRRAVHVPLPCVAPVATESPHPRKDERRLILCPSSGTRSRVIRRLKRFVEASGGRYRLVAKGRHEEDSLLCRVRKFLDDRDALMAECDLVFFGSEYEYRVSIAAHEALSYGKPVATLNCLFGREFARQFPHSIRPVDDVAEIESMSFDPQKVRQEQERLLRGHSYETVRDALRKAITADY